MMNITDSSIKLRKLADDNANYLISFEQYRLERKQILDTLDKNYNAINPQNNNITDDATFDTISADNPDKTQPYFANKLGQCMNFFKGSNNR